MSWAKLLADKRVTRVRPSKMELDNLRSIVTRSLREATATGLSQDAADRELRTRFQSILFGDPASPINAGCIQP
jgi:hypothetical protein